MITPPSTATPPPDPTGSTARMARSRHSPPFSFCCKTQDLVKHKGGLSEKQMHPGTRNGLYTIVLGHIGCIICRVHIYIYNLTNYNYICTHDFGIILDEWYTMVFGIILDEWYTMVFGIILDEWYTMVFGIILDEWYTMVFGIILDEWYTMVCHYFSIIVVAACTVVCGFQTIPSLAWNSSHLTVRHLTGIQEICDTRHLRNHPQVPMVPKSTIVQCVEQKPSPVMVGLCHWV